MQYSLVGTVERYAAVAGALDAGSGSKGSVREQAAGAITAVRQLMNDIDCPMRLRDVGVKRDLIPALAQAAYIDLNWWTNPRQVDEAVMAKLYQEAY
jgi:alcohol dehydrogenase class IV